MRRLSLASSIVGVILVAGSIAACQPPRAIAANPMSDALRKSWTDAKRNIVESAAQMPEAQYSFKATPDVRSFGQILAHVAGVNSLYCAAAKGEKPAHTEDEFEKAATTPAEIKKVLTEWMTYCDGAFTAATDASLGDPVDMPFGAGRASRATPLIANISHLNEHYGNLVTYFRLNQMVPPSSRR
jgi:uncharacterized damage-inducible protein DinB